MAKRSGGGLEEDFIWTEGPRGGNLMNLVRLIELRKTMRDWHHRIEKGYVTSVTWAASIFVGISRNDIVTAEGRVRFKGGYSLASFDFGRRLK